MQMTTLLSDVSQARGTWLECWMVFKRKLQVPPSILGRTCEACAQLHPTAGVEHRSRAQQSTRNVGVCRGKKWG